MLVDMSIDNEKWLCTNCDLWIQLKFPKQGAVRHSVWPGSRRSLKIRIGRILRNYPPFFAAAEKLPKKFDRFFAVRFIFLTVKKMADKKVGWQPPSSTKQTRPFLFTSFGSLLNFRTMQRFTNWRNSSKKMMQTSISGKFTTCEIFGWFSWKVLIFRASRGTAEYNELATRFTDYDSDLRSRIAVLQGSNIESGPKSIDAVLDELLDKVDATSFALALQTLNTSDPTFFPSFNAHFQNLKRKLKLISPFATFFNFQASQSSRTLSEQLS